MSRREIIEVIRMSLQIGLFKRFFQRADQEYEDGAEEIFNKHFRPLYKGVDEVSRGTFVEYVQQRVPAQMQDTLI